MKLLRSLLQASWLALFFISHAALARDADEGKPAPAFVTTTIDGEKFSLSGMAGKVVVINYWATWCSPCREEMPEFESYYREHQSEGLVMLAVSMDETTDLAKVKDVMKAYTFQAAMASDTSAKGYGRIWRIPLTFVIDRHGILRKDGWAGAKMNLKALDKIVTPLLREP
jgi:cytochrome c biogenesis protein CcmG, thiol:disulfide interchange protein DsbE